MKYWVRLIIFAVLNFGALAIGSIFTNPGTQSEWYQNLDKAPWTPPGFVFGIAWFTIMLLLSFFMANMTRTGWRAAKTVLILYAVQWVLNVLWNPLFFGLRWTEIALTEISLLFVVVTWLMILGFRKALVNGLLVLPYFFWLIIAVSLNAYIVVMN